MSWNDASIRSESLRSGRAMTKVRLEAAPKDALTGVLALELDASP